MEIQYILPLAISMAANVIGNLFRKIYADRYGESGQLGLQVFNAASSAVAALALFLVAGGTVTCSLFTALLALAFGASIALLGIFQLMAFDTGPYSYTTVIITLSMLMPALSGSLFFGEQLGWAHFVGIALMIACFVLSVEFGGEEKKASLLWFFYCMVAFLSVGTIGILQKVHGASAYASENAAFLIISFLFSFFYSLCISIGILLRRKKQEGSDEKSKGKGKLSFAFLALPLILTVFAGVFSATEHHLNLDLAAKIDAAVFFPVINGGPLILTTLVAVTFFRERLTRRQWLGLALGTLAVIFLCNPF